MAGGDSSSSSPRAAVVANADDEPPPPWEKQKPPPQPAAEEEEDVDPRFNEYDPKTGEIINIRFFNSRLDLDEESSFGPMRHTDKVFEDGFRLKNTVNVVSVQIVSSDYGYPLNVYGSILARDSLDRKCVYVFQRGQDNCQFISSKDDLLTLTGPKRGFMVCDDIFFEINLKVKDAQGRKVDDERLSKGLIEVDAIRRLSFQPRYKVETETLVSMNSILDLNYTFLRRTVEGTVEIRILEGPADFHGRVTACTSSIPCNIVLHDRKVSGVLTAGDDGVVQTARRVVGVSVDEMLLLTVSAAAAAADDDDEFSARTTVEFTPRRNGYGIEKIVCGDHRMSLKVTWSIVYF
ncbi:uncharacterized protein LOC100845682 [Brachypodium distachyon]|nr:uncharacterized protein LOC100845682 [Brachypodium distachyon]|eukprot:XP_003566706.2 uncharacterized protein LOC100845682 [Brachypodium distachyon]